jgi:hypothetical protein
VGTVAEAAFGQLEPAQRTFGQAVTSDNAPSGVTSRQLRESSVRKKKIAKCKVKLSFAPHLHHTVYGTMGTEEPAASTNDASNAFGPREQSCGTRTAPSTHPAARADELNAPSFSSENPPHQPSGR